MDHETSFLLQSSHITTPLETSFYETMHSFLPILMLVSTEIKNSFSTRIIINKYDMQKVKM